jgi:hypothetical protein
MTPADPGQQGLASCPKAPDVPIGAYSPAIIGLVS